MALLSLGCGITAAVFWYKSSIVPIEPWIVPNEAYDVPGTPIPELHALKEAARLQDLVLDRGDDEGRRVWQQIRRAIEA